MVTLLTNIFILMQNAGGKEMMAMLWAQQIMMKETMSCEGENYDLLFLT